MTEEAHEAPVTDQDGGRPEPPAGPEPETAEDAGTVTAEEAARGVAGEEAASVRREAPAEDDGGDVVSEDIAALAAKRDEYLELAQRTRADFDNYRKRMSREVAAAEKRGVGRLATELLPALDNLGRALEAAGDAGDARLAEGVKLVHAEIVAALARVGIEAYSPDGEPFDPTAHEAMSSQPVEGVESGTIVAVYQQGYRHGEQVLRPARVAVAA